jgi:hypothetical protein
MIQLLSEEVASEGNPRAARSRETAVMTGEVWVEPPQEETEPVDPRRVVPERVA